MNLRFAGEEGVENLLAEDVAEEITKNLAN